MKGYEPAMSFDEEMAEIYDEFAKRNRPPGQTTAAVDFLEGLARGGPALELAIGTGRIALPLAGRGVRVDGIDISPEMVAKLRGKPGGDELGVAIGDYADVDVDGEYRLVFVVANSLWNLLTQDDQVRCFENVGAGLRLKERWGGWNREPFTSDPRGNCISVYGR